VLYERWDHTIAREAGNRVYTHSATVGPEQLWVEDDSPHRYRAVLEPDTDIPAGLGLAFTYG
jgi:hypothetical protein